MEEQYDPQTGRQRVLGTGQRSFDTLRRLTDRTEDESEKTLDSSVGNFILHSWGRWSDSSTSHHREACGWRRTILWASLAH